MIPRFFPDELWREFLISLDGIEYISMDEIDDFFKKVYQQALELYKSRYFEMNKDEEKNWIKKEISSLKNIMEFKEKVLEKSKHEEILVPLKNEWVIKPKNLKNEILATSWRYVKTYSDKKMGFF